MNIFKGIFSLKMPYSLKKRKELLHNMKKLNNKLLKLFYVISSQ